MGWSRWKRVRNKVKDYQDQDQDHRQYDDQSSKGRIYVAERKMISIWQQRWSKPQQRPLELLFEFIEEVLVSISVRLSLAWWMYWQNETGAKVQLPSPSVLRCLREKSKVFLCRCHQFELWLDLNIADYFLCHWWRINCWSGFDRLWILLSTWGSNKCWSELASEVPTQWRSIWPKLLLTRRRLHFGSNWTFWLKVDLNHSFIYVNERILSKIDWGEEFPTWRIRSSEKIVIALDIHERIVD